MQINSMPHYNKKGFWQHLGPVSTPIDEAEDIEGAEVVGARSKWRNDPGRSRHEILASFLERRLQQIIQ